MMEPVQLPVKMMGAAAILLWVAILTAPLWLRVVNEVTTRTIGKAVTICPYCGVPGVVESTHPEVFR